MAATPPSYTTHPHYSYSIAQQQTVPLPAATLPPTAPFAVFPLSEASPRKQTIKRIVAIVTVLALFIKNAARRSSRLQAVGGSAALLSTKQADAFWTRVNFLQEALA